MTETSKKPNRKVVVGGLAGAVTSILMWVTPSVIDVEIPPEIAASITTVIFAVVSYLVPN